jgi:ABC-type transport system involved in multi-copper enzyme maturation permease subunit
MIENPVLQKELMVRLRSRHPAGVKWAVAVAIVALLLFLYQQGINFLLGGGEGVGRDGWTAGIVVQGILIWLLCPALASNAITQEKEQQTWDMLIFTLLSPMQILLGKLIARLLPIVAILTVFFPFMLFCLARGGIALSDLLLTYLIFGIWILFLTTVSLFMSWAFRKTATAIVTSFLVFFTLTIGTALIEATISAGRSNTDSPVIWLNPVRIVAALLDRSDHLGVTVILFSSITYVAAAAFLFWRMISQFRVMSIE